jgi:hypothetical protein
MTKNSVLSLCIPSHRDFDGSAHTMQSAVNFCKKSGSQCVVSDNSQDTKKEQELRKMMQGDNFRYIKSPPCDIMDNLRQVLHAADGEFVFIHGDDDSIFQFGETPDFSDLPADVVGIKPYVFAYSGARGIVAANSAPIKESIAARRVTENLSLATNGCNMTFYCFWRRSILTPLMDLVFDHHPTRAPYCDWALTHALVSSGKVITHPAASLFYNLHNWDSKEIVDKNTEKYFLMAGLPAGSSSYVTLLAAVDSFIFINRKSSPVAETERTTAAIVCFDIYLKEYIKTMSRDSAHENKNEILKLSKKLDGDSSIPALFALISDILSAIKPGLGEQYKEFYKIAADKAWGVI